MQIAGEQGGAKTMHSLFTPVDTLETTTYLHSVVQSNNSFALQWLMPVTGFEDNGNSVTPPGFDSKYGLYITIDASGFLNTGAPPTYTSIDLTLWADPKNDAGAASSTVKNGATFSGNTANDIVLAKGTMVSGTMMMEPDGTRVATYVESLSPTLDGTLLLGGSIRQGDLLAEHFTTPSDTFQAPTVGDTTVDLVNGGSAAVTLSSPHGHPATIRIPSEALQLPHLGFLHQHGR
jgi:hypothetical protein